MRIRFSGMKYTILSRVSYWVTIISRPAHTSAASAVSAPQGPVLTKERYFHNVELLQAQIWAADYEDGGTDWQD